MKWKKYSEVKPKPNRDILYSNGVTVWSYFGDSNKEWTADPEKFNLYWMHAWEIEPSPRKKEEDP